MKVGSQASVLSAPMFDPWTSHPWAISMRSTLDSLAQTYPRQGLGSESTASEADLSPRSGEQSTLFDLPGCSWKTRHESAPEDEIAYWPKSWSADTSLGTAFSPLRRLVRRMNVIGGGCLRTCPTPRATDHNGSTYQISRGREILKLCGFLRMLPTPAATDYKSPYAMGGAFLMQLEKRSKPLRDTLKHSVGIRLSPEIAEWLMGIPIGWTASRQPETGRCRSARRSPGDCLEVR